MSKTAIAKKFIRHYWSAKTRYGIHSPFVYDFVESVLEDTRLYYAFEEIEALRRMMLKNYTQIEVTDFGAGSHIHPPKRRRISDIARHSNTKPFFCRILFRMIQKYKPKTILELGTSFGLATLYMRFAALNSRIITVEGCPVIAHKAKQHFELLGVHDIEIVNSTFDQVLPSVLQELKQVDFAFIDGNHQEAATIQYFEQCLSYTNAASVLVFDDIHWSDGMERAWQTIQQHPKVTRTIDLFFFGVVFFDATSSEKTHFQLIPSAWRPFF